MCKSKPKPQVTTTDTSQKMDPWVTQAQQNLATTGGQVLAPFLSGDAYQVAGTNQDLQSAYGGVRTMADQAMKATPDNWSMSRFGAGDIQQFLNPYTRDVVDTTNKTIEDQGARSLN